MILQPIREEDAVTKEPRQATCKAWSPAIECAGWDLVDDETHDQAHGRDRALASEGAHGRREEQKGEQRPRHLQTPREVAGTGRGRILLITLIISVT